MESNLVCHSSVKPEETEQSVSERVPLIMLLLSVISLSLGCLGGIYEQDLSFD